MCTPCLNTLSHSVWTHQAAIEQGLEGDLVDGFDEATPFWAAAHAAGLAELVLAKCHINPEAPAPQHFSNSPQPLPCRT